MTQTQPQQAQTQDLGQAKIKNPLPFGSNISEETQVTMAVPQEVLGQTAQKPVYYEFEQAGPRKEIYFDPSKTKCAIVTCGGLCPGINDVIRSIVMEAQHQYKIPTTLGIRFGLQGFIPKYGHEVWELTPEYVSEIHAFGGTILGSSRGPQPPEEIVDALDRMNINILFLIGGDGTMKAATAIAREVEKRKMKISIIGIPKTIDNDIYFVSRTFGFDTAVTKATEAIRCAHTEALGAPNGIGMVKLMGREAGFIAAEASLAQKDVNFVLIPEEPFELDGPGGLLENLRHRLKRRGHAVIVVAEGAGQDIYRREAHLNGEQVATDPSGNPVLGDICSLLQAKIKDYFQDLGTEITLKFIDPSYIIRSIPANASDRVYCGFLGQNAVHAGMAGKTDMVVSNLQDHYIHLPLDLVTKERRKLNTNSNYWRAVLESTGQPPNLKG
ncbi:MAG: ATP-dependent 6-phosphofructokinase [Thermodesulfobacteriota bacterium]